jgi:hypothetical protein
LVVAVQPHSGVVVIETMLDPPVEANCALGGENAKSQVLMIAMNASSGPPPDAPCRELTVGKFVDEVVPVIYALPPASTTICLAESVPLPPRYVEKTRADPAALIFVKNTSSVPPALLF